MSQSTTRIRPTPPVIKWLLNERAMLAGEVQRRPERVAVLQAEIAKLNKKLESFDVAISMADTHVQPDAVGVVRETAKRYGGHDGNS